LSNFRIDHDLVAEMLEVPRADVLHHWPQIEIDAENGALLGPETMRRWP
jgi:hypothetical protein